MTEAVPADRNGSTRASVAREALGESVIKRVGVVGLGHMGHAFAMNLIEDGYEVFAYDRDPKRAEALIGAHAATRLADLADCDAVGVW